MIKIALIFPGQGSQSIGMGRDLYDNFKTAKVVFEEACDSAHFDLKKLCFEGPQEALDNTFNTQPALLTVSIAAYKVLMDESSIKADSMAGHSLGEYSALVAAGAINFTDAVSLVRFRGKVMSEAATESIGMMAAILGFSRLEIIQVIEAEKGSDVLAAANYNCPGQIVISGHKKAVERAMEASKKNGAKKAIPLAVSGPFHSELMEEASIKLKCRLSKLNFKKPSCAVYSNVTAKPYSTADEITPLLVRQMKSSVLWEDTINELESEGTDLFIEVGAGKVLTGLIKRTVKEAGCCNVGDTESLRNTIRTLNELRKIKN